MQISEIRNHRTDSHISWPITARNAYMSVQVHLSYSLFDLFAFEQAVGIF